MVQLRIGIVGAGLNADHHINFSKAYSGAQIVGVVDSDLSRAQACARKHGIQRAFDSTTDLLTEASPNVVHIVTPPRTHFDLVREVLEAGRHVLVEKPLALNLGEASALYEVAQRNGVQLCPVHNHLFDPCMRRADALIKAGALGRVINVESYYGLNTEIPAFRDYPAPNVLPWLYGLPGGVYQDFLPHPLYVLLEYTGVPRALTVKHRSAGVLPQDLPDELRIVVEGEHAFGLVTFSFAAKPHLHFVRVYGTAGMVEVDLNTMTTVVHSISGLPKAAQKAAYNLSESWQQGRATVSNMFRFVTGRLRPYHGMMTLIHHFYDAVQSGNPPPVPKDRALAVVRTMDAIFEQLKYEPLKHDRLIPSTSTAPQHSRRILVTGATGFLGKRLVKRLVANGYAVRVLARKLARVNDLEKLGIEVFWGDVADVKSFDQAFAGCDVVIHLAAGTSGTEKDSRTGTLQGTKNLLDLCRRYKPNKLVYISSCCVYGVTDYANNAVVSETASLERFPHRRGSYSASKLEAERYVEEYMRSDDAPVVILRPGTIYGPGADLYPPLMGFSMGRRYVVIGTGEFILPFVYVDNLVDAIVQSMNRKEAEGEVFNVIDTEKLSKREYVNNVIRRIHPTAQVFYCPYSLLYGMTWLQELVFRLIKRPPVLSRYRLISSQKRIVYDNRKLVERLGWQPRISMADALEAVVRFETRTSATKSLENIEAQTQNVLSRVDVEPAAWRAGCCR